MQRANARALAGGATLDTALDLARHIRQLAPQTPVALMSYYNPLWQRGIDRLAADLAAAQVEGLIVADLPVEEATDLNTALRKHGVGLAPLVAPTSPPERIRAIAAIDPVFVYCVALIGVTGARQDLSTALPDFLARVAAETDAPRVIGFGISTPDHVRRVAELGASGAIVASALADLVERSGDGDPVAAARTYLKELKAATLEARAASAST
jgi:tryptophan synthase alpha chain